ncbi:hypothetical protein AWE51_18935 [Aquimarina aggregata]|uniref:Uncharacterized protein n=1 Tax=Aquimarina aggregata TaxID=1642818 RepID=A0A162WIB6_9FLAO|nr:hypothetical protein [Aquimarina aggregata]KZS38121.1 hypothetical protein AWE51_18935 [Aquimarina aggregata]
MNLSRLLFFGIIALLFSCNSKNDSNAQQIETVAKLDSLSKDKITLDLLKLSTETEKDLESFEDFQNLKTLLYSLRDANPYYIDKYTDSLELLIQTFEENLSEDLNVNTINSRITVLQTESGLLSLLSSHKNPKAEKLLEANTRLAKAYNSLVIQLNELSLAIPESIEKELLRELEDEDNK